MNKAFQLCISPNEEDNAIGKILYDRDKIRLRKHFFNICLYIGPRNDYQTSRIFTKWETPMNLYYGVSECLSSYMTKKLWDNWISVKQKHTKQGMWFKEARESLKVLLDE